MRSEDIFEALTCDESLSNLTNLLAEAGGGRSSHIGWMFEDQSFELLSHRYYTTDSMKTYAESWAHRDPWVLEYFKPENANKLMPAHWVLPEPMFARSLMYNEFVRPWGDDTFHAAGASVVTPTFQGFFAVERSKSGGAFEETDLEPLRPVLRDLVKLLQVRGELGAARRRADRAEAVLNRLALAIVTVATDGRCIDLNEAATEVLARNDALTVSKGRLTARDPRVAQRLSDAIAAATARQAPHAASLVVPRAEPLRPYRLTASPLRTGAGPSLAMIVFRDPDSASGSAAAQARQLFGLSPAEASLAVSLAEGMTPDDMAQARRVSLNTIRTQLRVVSEKMGCNRLAQVAAIVASLPPT